MRKLTITLLLFTWMVYNSSLLVANAQVTIYDDSELSASGAILIEIKTGRVLYEKNADLKLPMASTTKIMTCLLALEDGNLNRFVTVADEASGIEGSSMYLGKGEKVIAQDLVYALMLASANDAAAALAIDIAGSQDAFCAMMNKRAYEIGAKDTNFTNPNGLPDDNHYTTAHDFALIAQEAMKRADFREIVTTKRYVVPWEGNQYDRVFINKNKLLENYEGALGIKIGFTKKAGRCLVFAAGRGDMELIGVLLGCGNWFNEAASLLDYGFENYAMRTIVNAHEPIANVVVDGETIDIALKYDLIMPLQSMEEMTLENILKTDAEIVKGQLAGELVAKMEDGQVIDGHQLIYMQDLIKTDLLSCIKTIAKHWVMR